MLPVGWNAVQGLATVLAVNCHGGSVLVVHVVRNDPLVDGALTTKGALPDHLIGLQLSLSHVLHYAGAGCQGRPQTTAHLT